MSQPLAARHLVDFASVTSNWNRINVSVGPSGEVVILSLKQKPDYRRTDKKGASFAKAFADRLNTFRLHCQTSGGWEFVDLAETRQNLRHVQSLPENKWLLVRARAKGDTDANGHVYSAEGDLLSTMPLGDCILDVQTTSSGQIWVSYFDQGIFENTKFGASGLASFTSSGVQSFDFNATTNWEEGMIADCYAFNVISETEVWLCPYTDFPLIKLKNTQIDHKWENNPVHGSHAFAVWKDRVLFRGGYADKQKLFMVYPYRSDGKELKAEEHYAVTETGGAIEIEDAFGRGPHLYLMTTDSLYSLDLREI